MHRYGFPLFALLAFAAPLPAADPAPKLLQDTWHSAYFGGVKAGYVHTTVQELKRDGQKLYRITRELTINIQRGGEVVPLRIEAMTEEKPDGKVVALGLTQFAGEKKIVLKGKVEGKKIIVTSGADAEPVTLPWNDKAIGMYHQDRIFKLKKVKPGDKLTFLTFEPGLLAPLTFRAVVKDYEEVPMLVPNKASGKGLVRENKKLLRVEVIPDKVEVNGTPLQLPGQTFWLDKALNPVRYEADLPGLGKATFYPTSAEVAKAGGAAAILPDLLNGNLVPVKKVIAKPHDTKSAVYRITIQGDKDPAGAFARDTRQTAKNVKGNSFELHVTSQREPVKVAKPAPLGKQYLASTSFLDASDGVIKNRAKKAIGDATDPWEKAKRIEKWVHENMKGSNAVGSATASQVARDLTGDCRQHALLTAAMCRAAKIPARTATGLVYFHEPDKKPQMAYHMWTEAYVKGQWLPLDATLGKGGIGACHLKIMDQDWRDAQTLAEHLPVLRVLGKLKVGVLSAK
jgi:hypothetical protein